MRVVSWNVNGIRAGVRHGFVDFVDRSGADIVGVQEVRARPEDIPPAARRPPGWHTLRQTPRFVYERIYCARGDIENRIKELLDSLQIDRTSCCRFWANQLRVLLTAAAYVLLQELRLRAARTACARAQVTWLRLLRPRVFLDT